MNKLSKDKKDKLILTCIGAIGAIAVLYFLVITDQKAELQELDTKIVALRSKKETAERLGKRLGNAQAELEAQRKALAEKQNEMPRPGEDHVWFLRIMEEMRRKYDLDIADIKTPEPTDAGVLPKFPFNAVALNVSMVGTYFDFGRFLADFENSYPYMRVQGLNIAPEFKSTREGLRALEAPAAPAAAADSGRLRFTYRVIALIKSPI